MDEKRVIENVSDTALWVAVYRAQETARPDAVFRDPLAAVLAGERGRAIAETAPGSRYTAWNLVNRTSIIDRMIMTLVHQGVDTVVNLGAGLDSRPYRLPLPSGLHWIEVDFPHMISYKQSKLKSESARCHLESVAMDLSDAKKRREFLDRVNAQSRTALVMTEGVLVYLENQQVAELAQDLHERGNFKYWIQDWYSEKTMNTVRKMNKGLMQKSPFVFHPDPDWFAYMKTLGWSATASITLGEESERIGRHSLLPVVMRILLWLLPAARKQMYEAGGIGVFQRT